MRSSSTSVPKGAYNNPAVLLQLIRDRGPLSSLELFDLVHQAELHGQAGDGPASEFVSPSFLDLRREAISRQLRTHVDALEQLGLIARSAQKILSVTPRLRELQDVLHLSLAEQAAKIGRAGSETGQAMAQALHAATQARLDPEVRHDLVATLAEISRCVENGSNLAAVALSGRVLEIALRWLLLQYNQIPNDGAMVGTLLAKVRELGLDRELPPTITNVCNVINQARISAIHARGVPHLPSHNEAHLVVHAVVDVLNATMLRSKTLPPV